jgi:hypothetical protein
MTPQEFQSQVNRLESQWPHSYGEERKALLWAAFSDVGVLEFKEAVSSCIANLRGAPLLDELSKAVETAKVRAHSYRPQTGFWGVMKQAEWNNKISSKDHVAACLKLLSDFMAKRLTKEQFIQGCDYLDQAAAIANPKSTAVVGRGYKYSPKED